MSAESLYKGMVPPRIVPAGEMEIYVAWLALSLLTSSFLNIKHQDWHCKPQTAEKQHQQNNEILRNIFNVLFQSIRFHTSPIKHLLPRQEPKHPRKLMRTVRDRHIKRKVTGMRKTSPLWSKRRFSMFVETFVKIATIKRRQMLCSKITSGGRFDSTGKPTPAKIPPTMMRIVKLNIYNQNMEFWNPKKVREKGPTFIFPYWC